MRRMESATIACTRMAVHVTGYVHMQLHAGRRKPEDRMARVGHSRVRFCTVEASSVTMRNSNIKYSPYLPPSPKKSWLDRTGSRAPVERRNMATDQLSPCTWKPYDELEINNYSTVFITKCPEHYHAT